MADMAGCEFLLITLDSASLAMLASSLVAPGF